MSDISRWMAWDSGVDLVAKTNPDFDAPNLIIHVAANVITPVGEAAAGMIMWQPDPSKDPILAGFLSDVKKVGRYLGPNIFEGTMFRDGPYIPADVDVEYKRKKNRVTAFIEVDETDFEIRFDDIGPLQLIDRPPSDDNPYHQQGLEASVGKVRLRIDGEDVEIVVADLNLAGGAGAVWSPSGLYAR